MARFVDADGEWEAELDADGRFKSGYLVTPSPTYEAQRAADAVVDAQRQTGRETVRAAKAARLASANTVAELRSYIEDELS